MRQDEIKVKNIKSLRTPSMPVRMTAHQNFFVGTGREEQLAN